MNKALPKITTREQLGLLFESVKNKGVGVELGVQLGWNCKRIIDSGWTGSIIAVDNWIRMYELECAKNILKSYNVEFRRGDTAEVISGYKTTSFDWVYIDADHSYEGVKRDFEAAYDAVRSGGIIAGHDYGANNDCQGVKQFIDEYMQLHPEIEMHFTTDDFYVGDDERLKGMEYQTWWFVKP